MSINETTTAKAPGWRGQLAQLAAIVANSNDAIFSRTLAGTILSWNAGAERMLGYAAAEMIGKPVAVTLPPGFPSGFLTADDAPILVTSFAEFRRTFGSPPDDPSSTGNPGYGYLSHAARATMRDLGVSV